MDGCRCQRDPTDWLGRSFTGQFSLAGTQAKTALLLRDGRWDVPSGSIPTTHILKPAVSGLDDHDLNEHLCLEAASRIGLLTARTTLTRFGEKTAVVVARYDRRLAADGSIARIHREDLCQALGVPPSRKYQNEGGPGPAQVARLLRASMPAAVAEQTLWRFADALIWNWLIGGTDAHATNYSLLLSGDQARLAPLYDIASALPIASVHLSLPTTVTPTESSPLASAATVPQGPVAVSVQDVSKTFRLPHQQYSTLKERMLHPLRSTAYDELPALKEISVEISDGEFFGIVGRNGSGKSTLLKCIAGIYGVDRGRIDVVGRLSPFIELGVGFNMDLTARDNVIINAIMLGLSRRNARARFDEVIAFAELEEFVDLKLKNYSSGMLVRLAFATAIQVNAEILLIDEVLAVGDAAFQQKCFEEFFRLKREGRTIVFVSHDMYSVERFCNRAMLLDKGRMVQIGHPHDIARAYHKLNFGHLPHELSGEAEPAQGSQTKLTDAWFEDVSGQRVTSASGEQPLAMCFEASIAEDLLNPVFAATLRNELGHTVLIARSDRDEGQSGSFKAGESVVARFDIPNWLAPGRYTLTPSVAREGTGASAVALQEDMTSILIHGDASGGLLELPVDVRIERT